ncbi:sugar ABC transporter permease [Bifidobacterium sp. B4081]|uniref:carbohydrate ABC transporter permease n=1 Tax=unclassified Bifidobacterium TaxID=2608897 RepID=UPI00226A46DD|nr:MULTISPECIES: sugar ABC transporter permease [unclassified Bifidobacterium]MCX8643868.1 sugar ABC transporter permease [Bifidobacterium sp. B4077]MCX8646050.1 sugar ABC transporter permease [Bifidobacterium sp. B4081]MCX8669283.1 sugar ABC transporter permease [Bifidobacterium sp. B3998]
MLPYRSKKSVLIFILPPLLLYGAGVLLPVIQSLIISFFDWDGISDMKFTGLANYIKMLTGDSVFWQSFGNSMVYLVICLVLQLGGALLVATLLTGMTKGRDLVKTLYLLPAVISTVAISFLFQRIYSVDPKGLLNQTLDAIGLHSWTHAWLSDPHTVLSAVSIPEGWRFSGLYMLIIYAAFMSVPPEIEEAARLDGANGWQLFTKIRFPYIRPVWITTVIMAVTYGLRGFDIPYLLTNGRYGQLVTTYMYRTAFSNTNYGYASAISVFIVIECLIAVALIFKVIFRKEEA